MEQKQSAPVIITNPEELRDFLAQWKPKRKARRRKVAFVQKKDWQHTLRQAAANTERQADGSKSKQGDD